MISTSTGKHAVLILFLTLTITLAMAGTLFVQPALADSVVITGPPKWYERGRVKGWQVYFNVTNDGLDPQPIYDFHVSISGGAKIVGVSTPKSWNTPVKTQWEVGWKTNSKPIVNGTSNAGFDIVTDLQTYGVYWMTTDKNGSKINDGYFNVP